MMDIRKAHEDDFPRIFKLLQAFHEESLSAFNLGFNHESAYKTMRFFMDNHVAFVVINDDKQVVGLIAGIISPYFLNYEKKIFQEAVWYVEHKFRGTAQGIRLLRLIEDYCDENDLTIGMICMSNLNDDKMKKFYQKRGYKFLETHYIRNPK